MRIARRWLLSAGLVGFLAAGLWYAFAAGPSGPPSPAFPKGTIASVTISLQEVMTSVPSLTVTSADAGKIEALAAVLRRGEPTEDHKCADIGRITFRSKDGSETSLGILPAHNPKRYEYRAHNNQGYGIFHVDRNAFVRAMTGLGIEQVALVPTRPR